MTETLEPYSEYVRAKMEEQLPEQVAELFDLIGEYSDEEDCRALVYDRFMEMYPGMTRTIFDAMYEVALDEWIEIYTG